MVSSRDIVTQLQCLHFFIPPPTHTQCFYGVRQASLSPFSKALQCYLEYRESPVFYPLTCPSIPHPSLPLFILLFPFKSLYLPICPALKDTPTSSLTLFLTSVIVLNETQMSEDSKKTFTDQKKNMPCLTFCIWIISLKIVFDPICFFLRTSFHFLMSE